MRRTPNHRCPRRPSFTLIEILVVISIITVLMALTVGAVMRFLQMQAEKNTISIIGRIDSSLDKQWRYVIDKAKNDPIPDVVYSSYAGPIGSDDNRARVIYTKLKLKQQFPMSYLEALNNPLGPDQAFVRELGAAGIGYGPGLTPPSWPPGPDESSVCLLIALKQGRGGLGLSPDDLGVDVVKPSASGKGLQKMVDFWGTPLRFYRWPTLDGGVDGSNPATPGSRAVTVRDLQDGEGKLMDPNWWNNQNLRLQFELQCHLVSTAVPPPATPPPVYTYAPTTTQAAIRSYYMVPVIVSAGPNKKFGIAAPPPPVDPATGLPATAGPWADPMLSDGSSDSNDNIYSYRLRLGGSGN